MPLSDPNRDPSPGKGPWFATTHWSVVLAAGSDSSPGTHEALEKLCRIYWYPLYAFLRRQGCQIEEAQDLTQDFFARLLAKNYLSLADPARGRFRTFLLAGLKNFLLNERRNASRPKRGATKSPSQRISNSAPRRRPRTQSPRTSELVPVRVL